MIPSSVFLSTSEGTRSRGWTPGLASERRGPSLSLASLLALLAFLPVACDEAAPTDTEAENQPPSVTIDAPSDGATFVEGDSVTFRGSGEDPEDGALTGSSLKWVSSVDSVLGTGEELTVTTLSAASHTIYLAGVDSDSAVDTASISLTVEHPPAAVVINEVENRHIDGPRHGDDYVELYVTADGTLEGMSLELLTMDGQTYAGPNLEGVVSEGDYVLIGGPDRTDADYSFAGLQDGPGGARILAADSTEIDAVQWGAQDTTSALAADGSSFQAEGTPIAALPLQFVAQRKTDGEDTGDNGTDFCLQGEDQASPGSANVACPEAGFAAVAVRFYDPISSFYTPGPPGDLEQLVLTAGEWGLVGVQYRNLQPPATDVTAGLTEGATSVDDPSVAVAADLLPLPAGLELNPGESYDIDEFLVACLVEQGKTTVSKFANADNDPWGGVDLLTVICDPNGDPDGPTKAPDDCEECDDIPDEDGLDSPPDSAAIAIMDVTIQDHGQSGELGAQVLGVGDSLTTAVEIRNLGDPITLSSGEQLPVPLPNVQRPDIDPDGLGLYVQGTFPRGTDLYPNEEVVDPSVTFICDSAGVFVPAAKSHSDTLLASFPETSVKTSDVDDLEIECIPPLDVFFGQTDFNTNEGGIGVVPADGSSFFDVFIGVEAGEDYFGGMSGNSFLFIKSPIGKPDSATIWHSTDDGSTVTQLVADTAFYRRGSANADGTKYVFESDRDDPQSIASSVLNDVFVMNADGSGITNVVADAGFPSFTPDGRIVYSTDADADGHYEVRIADANGTNESLLIDDDAASNHSFSTPVVSPDGSRIAVTRDNTSTFESHVMVGDFDGSSVTNLTRLETGGDSFQPAWSPSGDRIAFTSSRDNNAWDLFVADVDGTNVINLTQTSDKYEFHAFWGVP